MSWFRATFQDEAPAIGSGRRTVFVHSRGPRRVRIRNPYTLRVAVLPREAWDAIARTAREIRRPRNVKPAVTRLLKSTGQARTAAIRDMCRHAGKAI